MNKTVEFLPWSDPFSIILCSLAATGIIVTIVFAVLFAINLGTPAVPAGWLLPYVHFHWQTYPELKLRRFAALWYSLYPLHLLHSGQLVSNPVGLQLWSDDWALDKEAKSTIGACDCCLWDPGGRISVMADLQPTHSSRDPSGQNYPAPVWDDVLWVLLGSAMLVYNGCLGLTCFLFAFKGRQLPDLYKNASLITVSMMLFMVIWIIFLPLYLTMSGKYKPAIVMALSWLSSFLNKIIKHLGAKWLKRMLKQEVRMAAPSEYIRKHYERKGLPVIGTQHWFAKK